MLTDLTVHHFKSIEKSEISFGDVTLFVGNNGSGKTNVMDAIRFLKDATQHGLDRAFSDRHGVESVRQWSPTRPYRIILETVHSDTDYWAKYNVAIDSAKGDYQIVREEIDIRESLGVTFENSETDDLEEGVQYQRTHTRRDKDGRIKKKSWRVAYSADDAPKFTPQSLTAWDGETADEEDIKADILDELLLNHRARWEYGSLRRRIVDFQAYSIFPNTLRVPQEPSNETFLAPEGRNLASVFKRMRRTKRGSDAISQITDAMRSILPNLERISILSVGGFLVPQFHMLEPNGKRHIFNVAQMSDGTLRVLGLLTALYQEPRPSIVALEEPEQTINPGILSVIAESIKEVSRRTQVIITTHSPHFLDQFDPGQVRTVEFEEGRSKVSEVGLTQIEVVRERLFTLGELLVSEGLHGDQ